MMVEGGKNQLAQYMKQVSAALAIQMTARRYVARRRLRRLSQRSYVKFVDDQGAETWQNPRSGHLFFSKPLSLGDSDCGAPVKKPSGDQSLVVDCSICENVAHSTLFCEECDKHFCQSCFKMAHKNANKKNHTYIDLSLCVQCDYQVSSRRCDQCEDLYCDSCFNYVHRKGRLRLHTCVWVTDRCFVCENSAAKWVRAPPDENFKPTNFCTPCIRETYGEPIMYEKQGMNRVVIAQLPYVTKYKYTGCSVDEFRENKRRVAMRKVRKSVLFNEIPLLSIYVVLERNLKRLTGAFYKFTKKINLILLHTFKFAQYSCNLNSTRRDAL